MKDEIITYKTAKLAKELDFDEDVSYMFGMQNNPQLENFDDSVYMLWGLTKAPTQSLLLRWLREEHNIVVEIRVENNQKNFSFISRIHLLNHIKPLFISNLYERYEEALEAGLFEALKLIKNENS